MPPRTLVYPMEVAELMELIKTGRRHTLPEELEQIGAVTASMCAARGQYAELRLCNYEEALKSDSSS